MDLKTLYNIIRVKIPDVSVYDIKAGANQAIRELNTKNLMQERERKVNATADGEIDLSLLNIIAKLILVKDPAGMVLIPRSKEYVRLFADEGELVYNETGKKLYVNPMPLDEETRSSLIEFIAPNIIKYTGTVEEFWEEHDIIPGTSAIISGAVTAANNVAVIVDNVLDELVEGSHSEDESGYLEDSSAAFPTDDSLVGRILVNLTKHATGIITSNTATEIYAVMTVDDDVADPDDDEREAGTGVSGEPWDKGDSYRFELASGNILEVTTDSDLVDETAISNVIFSVASYVYEIVSYENLPEFSNTVGSDTISIDTIYEQAIIYLALFNLFSMTKHYDQAMASQNYTLYSNEIPAIQVHQEQFRE